MDKFLSVLVVWIVTPILLLSSIYMSLRLGWPQFTRLGQAFRRVLADSGSSKRFGNFSAVAVIVGGNLGAGTIAGTALAIRTGGPGAILWMVAVALLGGVIKLSCASLGVFYQEPNGRGGRMGGAMFYMAKGLNSFPMGAIYCVLLVGAALSVGNLVQINAFVSSLPKAMPAGQPIAVLLLAVPAAFILCGSLRRFSKFMTVSIPILGCVYIAICCCGILLLRGNVVPVMKSIFRAAFSPTAMAGGAGGAAILATIQSGISRGLFATDIGLGLAAIAHGEVSGGKLPMESHAREQGAIALLSPLIVAVICAITGILILCAAPNFSQCASEICVQTFSIAYRSPLAGWLVPVTIYCFALTTMVAWAWFAEHAFYFFRTPKLRTVFRAIFIGIMPVGAFMHSTLPWTIADGCIAGLLLTNVLAIVLLRRKIEAIYREK
ncbi:MAG: alanine:cation symporter family protein [Puniceicoccales bacterium]|jgi:Na+/alanine symporter|nr:alanine:cation symporter family protein [Puniceicoccales bacterium]